MALQKYGSGKFKLSQLIAPAIDLARNGYQVGDDLATRSAIARMARWPSTAKLFLTADVLSPRHLLIQADLAATLDAIANEVRAPFTKGPSPTRLPPRCAGAAAS